PGRRLRGVGFSAARRRLQQYDLGDGVMSNGNGEFVEVPGAAPPAAAARGVKHFKYVGNGAASVAPEPEDREALLAKRKRERLANGPKESPRTDSARRSDKPATLITVRASDVVMKPIDWGWPGRIALGKPTLLAGEPGMSKSTLLLTAAATFSMGGKWPCGEGTAPKGSIIILSADDDMADNIVPRFLAAGGDTKRLHIIRAVQEGDNKRGFNLQADLARLEAKIRELKDVVAVIIDPISSYMGKTDSHKNSETRGVIDP